MVPILRASNSNWFDLNQWNLATSLKSIRICLAADYNIDKKCSHQLWWFDTYQVFCLHRSTQPCIYYALVGNTSLSLLHLLDNLVLTKCLLLGPHNEPYDIKLSSLPHFCPHISITWIGQKIDSFSSNLSALKSSPLFPPKIHYMNWTKNWLFEL